MAVIKISSKGHGKADVQANLRYIARGDYVLRDEMGRAINAKDAIDDRYDFSFSKAPAASTASKNAKARITDYRVIATLPTTGTDRAREIVQEIFAQRYHSFVQAYHDGPGKNPHIHFNLANYKYHPLAQWRSIERELQPLSAEIDRRFAAEGISYNFKKGAGLTAVKTQCEIHREEKGLKNWKDEMRKAVKVALTDSRDFSGFEAALKKQGINISRKTEKSLTFSDAAGRKVRLGRLFSGLKCRADVEARINNNANNASRVSKPLSSFSQRLPSLPSGSGPTGAGNEYEAGDEGIDDKMTEDEKRAIRYRNRQRQIAAAQMAQAGAVKQGIAQGIPGGLRPSQGILQGVPDRIPPLSGSEKMKKISQKMDNRRELYSGGIEPGPRPGK